MSWKVLLIVLSILGCSFEVFAFDFKKELKKVVENEKKKYEEQQKKEKEKNAAPPPAAAPAQLQPGGSAPAAAPAAPAVQPPPPAQPPPTAPASAPPAQQAVAPVTTPDFSKMTPDERIRYAWKNLGSAKDGCNDYITAPFPKNVRDSSGMMTACRISSLVDQKYLEKVSGLSVFIDAGSAAPAGKTPPYLFNHYNKKFVDWAAKHAIPAATDRAFKMSTQTIYKEYLSTSSESFLKTIYTLEAHPKHFAQMQKKYLDAMTAPGGIMGVESFIRRLIQDFPVEPGPASTVSFWLRRSIDGSATSLKSGLEQLIRAYTPERVSAIKAASMKSK